ncbi:MAG: tail fiber domain-containing protein [Candidatus Korobacteraceae bacterium]|jgi:hypothetical protein
MRRFRTNISVLFSILLLISMGFAQQNLATAVPNLIRYSGTLKDAQGGAFTSTAAGVTFAIYKQQDGGAPVWMETQTVTPDASGNYSVLLGGTTATGLPADLFSQEEQRWLGVQVEGQAEQPRVLLVSVPYAFKAHEAETLGGKSVSDFVLANTTISSANGSNASQASSSPANNPHTTTPGINKGAASAGPTNFSGATIDQIVGVTQSGSGAGVNASAPTKGIVGTATATSGTVIGVEGGSAGSGGYGVYGNVSSSTGATVGVKGNSTSTAGTGVRGTNTATSGATTGVSGYVASAAGIAGAFNNAAGGKILSGQNNGVEQFSVDGSGNINSASGAYRIGGSSVVNIASPSDDNLFLGVGAGTHNVAGQGQYNAFSGTVAGYLNTTGSYNTFAGFGAGYQNTTGAQNAFFGNEAGASNATACCNLFSGYQAGYNNTLGTGNTFNGYQAGYSNTGDNLGLGDGSSNSFYGYQAGYRNTTGQYNTFLGLGAGYSNTGSNNIFLGAGAGDNNTTGFADVYVANFGPSSGTESNTIRIGTPGTDNGTQHAAYIAGIYDVNSPSSIPVYINSNGQLGTVVSSRRFKEQVTDMGDSTSALMKLRPVTFLYKPEYANGDRTLQYGLIAEEVAQVYPELVAYDNDGQPYTVRYQYITTMLLNEVQKQYRRAEHQSEIVATQQAQIKAQQQEIESLKQQLQMQNAAVQERLSRLEKVVGTQTVAQK